MRDENGNVLLFILIAIVLYGALTFALSNSDGASDFNTDTEQFKAELGELYNYASTMQSVVQKLKTINGCDDNDIDFYVSGVTHANYQHADSNFRCNVFHPKGGGMSYASRPDMIIDAGVTADYYRFIGTQSIDDVGTTKSELIFSALVTEQACEQINTHMDITNPSGNPPASSARLDEDDFFNGGNVATTGEYNDNVNVITVSQLAGEKSGCVHDSTDGNYAFYHVLIAR